MVNARRDCLAVATIMTELLVKILEIISVEFNSEAIRLTRIRH